MTDLTTLDGLREIYPPPAERSLAKQVDRLDGHCRRLIALSPFVVVSTASAAGLVDASPKGGPPGFVRVLDDERLLIPDATGNRRLDGFQNIVENPRAGLLFLVPGLGETLRVNGRAELTTEPALIDGLQTGGKPAKLGLLVHAEEVFLHCAKALIRSRLWDPASWPARDALPSAAEILNDHIGLDDLAASEAALQESYRDRL